MTDTYTALWVSEGADGTTQREVKKLPFNTLPENDVLIKVHYAALNYKDALSASGHKGITRNYPHTPGIDAAGEVVRDKTGKYASGDIVLVTSYDLGMNTFGGFAEYICVPASWIVPMPGGLNTLSAMVLGTAGFTAALALHKMELSGQKPSMGPVLVTGASGGVGSLAIALLSRAGYDVIASTGKAHEEAYLKELGATQVINRNELSEKNDKPFAKTRWAGAIDTVGGITLTNILKACGLNGSVAACGLVADDQFTSTIYPFIIKGNNLLGIESATCEMELRQTLWMKLASVWKFSLPESSICICSLKELNEEHIPAMLTGKSKGRVVVKFV